MKSEALSLFGRFDGLGRDGHPSRLGIMGGTFNPIHMGHLRVAEEVREALGLDGVLFVPAGDPVFKKGQQLAPAAVRLEQVRLAVAGNPHFDVSSLEVERPGDTYTVDTLRELRQQLPASVEPVFIMGEDAAEDFPKWREPAEVGRLAHLAVAVGRPGTAGNREIPSLLAPYAERGLELVPVSSLEVSSRDIRRRAAEGMSLRYLVPQPVESRAFAHRCAPGVGGLVWSSAVPVAQDAHGKGDVAEGAAIAATSAGSEADALSKAFYRARKAELAGRVDDYRFRHSVGVAKTAKMLAKCYGVNPKKARLAGILHDWDKGLDDAGIRARVVELGMENQMDPVLPEAMPRVLHGITAACALKRGYPQIPADVLQAVDRHTVAARDMEPLDMVVYIADAIEPNRQGEQIGFLRGLVGKVGLEELFFETFKYWTMRLMKRGRPLHPDTIGIWNAYALKLNPGKDYVNHD